MKENVMKVFLCGVEFQEHLGFARVTIYPDVESIPEGHGECGVVECELSFVKWVSPQIPFSKRSKIQLTPGECVTIDALISNPSEPSQALKDAVKRNP